MWLIVIISFGIIMTPGVACFLTAALFSALAARHEMACAALNLLRVRKRATLEITGWLLLGGRGRSAPIYWHVGKKLTKWLSLHMANHR